MGKEQIVLLTVKDIKEITGWSPAKINEVMAREDFPVIKIGKENQVLLESFKKFLEIRRDLRGDKS